MDVPCGKMGFVLIVTLRIGLPGDRDPERRPMLSDILVILVGEELGY